MNHEGISVIIVHIFSLQISEHHSFPIATTKSDLRSNRMRLKRASGQVGEKEAGRGAMFIIVKPIHHSRLPANTFYKLDKYILQFGQMHFTIWEGGMIIISKANSSVAPPAGKEEFHHFFTQVALQSLLSQHCCSVLTNKNTKNHREIQKITEKYFYRGALQIFSRQHCSALVFEISSLSVICLALWGYFGCSCSFNLV